MGETVVIRSIEQLQELYANNKGIVEIAMRDRRKKFLAFDKVIFDLKPQEQTQELLQNAMGLLNKTNGIAEKSLKVINSVAKLQQLSLIINGINLCATCAGFAIMFAKLNKMSGEIAKLMETVKQGHEIQTNYEFQKILSEHSNMLDARKTQKYYTEEQLRQLVDGEYNVLTMLVRTFLEDLTVDSESLVFAIYSLAAMLAVTLRYFDELYYYNNKESIGDGAKWHVSHEKWTSVYDELTEESFVKKLQDHCIFDLNLSTRETDAYYQSLCAQVRECAEDIRDNQELILALDSKEAMAEYRQFINRSVEEDVRKAFEDTDDAMENPEVQRIFQEAMNQVVAAA